MSKVRSLIPWNCPFRRGTKPDCWCRSPVIDIFHKNWIFQAGGMLKDPITWTKVCFSETWLLLNLHPCEIDYERWQVSLCHSTWSFVIVSDLRRTRKNNIFTHFALWKFLCFHEYRTSFKIILFTFLRMSIFSLFKAKAKLSAVSIAVGNERLHFVTFAKALCKTVETFAVSVPLECRYCYVIQTNMSPTLRLKREI